MSTVDLTRPRDVRGLLNRYGVRLSRELGQHLLVDRDVLQRIVEAADLTPQTEVLEVGPGVGALTAELSRAAGRVVAVELDRRLVDLLRETAPFPNVEVIQGDALQANLPSLFQGRPYSVVANLPYNVATPLIRRLLYAPPQARPDLLVLMVQREVGRRLAAPPGGMSRLSVETQLVADVELLFEIGPQAFLPPPEVSSAVDPHASPARPPRPHPPHRAALLPDRRGRIPAPPQAAAQRPGGSGGGHGADRERPRRDGHRGVPPGGDAHPGGVVAPGSGPLGGWGGERRRRGWLTPGRIFSEAILGRGPVHLNRPSFAFRAARRPEHQ